MLSRILPVLGIGGLLTLVAVGWNSPAPPTTDEVDGSAPACPAFCGAGSCERDGGARCKLEPRQAGKDCDPARCPACPGCGPNGCDLSKCVCHGRLGCKSAQSPQAPQP